MPIHTFDGKTPRIHPTAFIAQTAVIIGDVEIGEGSSVWPGAVLRADSGTIRIGKRTHIEDNCVFHAGGLQEVGDDITVGHSAVVHCRRVGDGCLIANNSTLLEESEIGAGSIVAAGAVVTPRTVIPPGSFVVGIPAKVVGLVGETSRGSAVLGGARTNTHYADLMKRYKDQGFDTPRP